MVQIALIGDIHGCFDELDLEHFNRSSYDLLLFTGDLERLSTLANPFAPRRVAALLARLTRPALLIPGNHEGATLLQLAAEVLGSPALAELAGGGHLERVSRLVDELGPVAVGGLDARSFDLGGPEGRFDLVVARPFSMGGPRLSFRPLLRRGYGLGTVEASAERLLRLVERCPSERLLFLAHNGPSGLGARRSDIWGRDFGRREGDWGDRDLELAVAHARGLGKRVLAVVAGHMHLAVRGGGERPSRLEREGVLYVNAARVPRIFERDGRLWHHHLRLALEPGGCRVEEVLIPGEGGLRPR